MVHVFRHKPVSVIDHDPVPSAVAPAGDQNRSCRCCICRCPDRRRIIISFMSSDLEFTNLSKIAGLICHPRAWMGKISISADHISPGRRSIRTSSTAGRCRCCLLLAKPFRLFCFFLQLLKSRFIRFDFILNICNLRFFAVDQSLNLILLFRQLILKIVQFGVLFLEELKSLLASCLHLLLIF